MRRIVLLFAISILSSALYAQEAKTSKQDQNAKAEAAKQAAERLKLDTPKEATTDILADPTVEVKAVNPKADLRAAQEQARKANAQPSASEKKSNANSKEAKKEE